MLPGSLATRIDRSSNIEEIFDDTVLIALIVRREMRSPMVQFFTPTDSPLQLGCMSHPQGHVIAAHEHVPVSHLVTKIQEVLVIRRGKLRVDLYAQDRKFLSAHILCEGDVILLAAGGHGFKAIEDLEMLEIKQGPYLGQHEKRPIEPAPHSETVMQENS
jgi:hypothetical protein